MSSTFTPTAEQQAAADHFLAGRSLVIEAGAGTGKTSTLRHLASLVPDKRIVYVAFNKAIVEEARRKMPENVHPTTAHSLAYRAVVNGTPFQARLRAKRMSRALQARLLGLDPIVVKVPAADGKGAAGRKVLQPHYLASVVGRAIERFCQTADEEPTEYHVPRIKGIDLPGQYANQDEVARALVLPMRRAWKDLTNPDGRLPYRHSHYLKMWQLTSPRIDADVILFDEAQDANPVMQAIVSAQEAHAQVVWVGDSQQQIYSFTGAVNALARVQTDARTFLTQSFRFGQGIADQANVILKELNAELRIKGNPAVQSHVGVVQKPHAILCRTNAAAVTLVLKHLELGNRPHLVGGAGEVVSFAQAALELMENGQTHHHELACFDSWQQVLDFVRHDEQGDELRLLVRLVEEFTPEVIIEGLGQRMASERDCDVLVSTAHKAKGREWPTVALASDFPEDRGKMSDEEWRLLYVAVTRGMLAVDVSRVAVLQPEPAPEPKPAPEPEPAMVGV